MAKTSFLSKPHAPPTCCPSWNVCTFFPHSLSSPAQHQLVGISWETTKDAGANDGAVSQLDGAWALGQWHPGDHSLATSSVRRVLGDMEHATEALGFTS